MRQVQATHSTPETLALYAVTLLYRWSSGGHGHSVLDQHQVYRAFRSTCDMDQVRAGHADLNGK